MAAPGGRGTLGFRPMLPEDLPLLWEWLGQPHVAAWWGLGSSLEELRAEYLPALTGADSTRCFLMLLDGREIGMVQTYPWDAEPVGGPAVDAVAGEWGLDYLIGDPALIGRGLGTELLGRFVDEVVSARLGADGIRTCVAVGNVTSWRCLEKLGFSRSEPRAVAGEDGPQYVLTLARSLP